VGYYAYIPTQFCVQSCPTPYYGDPSTRTCVDVCPINQLLYADNVSRTCVKKCPSSSYASQWAIACLSSCPVASPPYVQTYAADYDNTCTEQCAYPYFSYAPTYQCLSQCPDPYYNKVDSHICQLCPSSCTTCTSATKCKGCVLGYFLQSGQCLTSCTLIYYANPTTRTCVTSLGCAPYFGINSTHSCASSCPNGQFANIQAYRCYACPSTCTSCLSLNNCLTCITPSVSYLNFCYGYCNTTLTTNNTGMYFSSDNLTCTTSCPAGTYPHVVYCKSCASQCSTCLGNASNCTNCTSGKYLYNNSCVN
jgi:proprotein convertase subtilisin/kexin type 5